MKSEKISNFLKECISAGDFPSAVYLVAEKGEISSQDALGFAVKEPEAIAATQTTIYDLASVTKPLVGGMLTAKLYEQNEIDIDHAVSKYLPAFDTTDKKEITIKQLLIHTSGLPSWRPFYFIGNKDVVGEIAQQPLEYPTGSKVVYSDPNFIVLGFLLEKLFGEPIDKIAEREIFVPLGLKDAQYKPSPTLKKRIAAGAIGNPFEKELAKGFGYDLSNYIDRDHRIWGEVDDGNCNFLGGATAHAGVFSTAAEVFEMAKQFLPETTRLLKPETCKLFSTNFTHGLNEARSFSFELAATEKSTAGELLPKNSFGHLGFTGTSLWIDPEKQRIFILLTNRTHHEFPFVNINAVRRRFHDMATSELNNAG